MGFCCSKAAQVAYKCEKYMNEDAWLQWDKHEARRHYQIERVLGRGAFSEVVAAVSKETGRRVALKVVFLDNPGLQQQHADVLQAEVTIMEKLNDPKHPNIVSFENIIHDPIRKQLVIAEEILLGGTLTDELLHGSNCNNDRLVAHIFKQIFSALEHVHSKNIVHRDLKPENVMFRAPAARWSSVGAVPVLIDFGMSQELRPGGPPVNGLLGSPGFVAPEVIDGEAHSPAQDMFAVGVMLYITITGRRPMTNRQANTLTYSKFEAWDYPHMHSDAVWMAANSSAKDIVLSLLERDPSRRLTAAEARHHPWVTADMKVQRPLASGSVVLAVAQDTVLAEKRCRLTQERHQGHVEEMLHYMVLALQARDLQGAAAAARKGSMQVQGRNTRGVRSANPSMMATPSMLSDIRVHLPEAQAFVDIVATGGSHTSSELISPRTAYVPTMVTTSTGAAAEQGMQTQQDKLPAPGMPQRSPSPNQRHASPARTAGAAGSAVAALHGTSAAVQAAGTAAHAAGTASRAAAGCVNTSGVESGGVGGAAAARASPFDRSVTRLRQQRVQRWHSDITNDARAKKGMQMAADAAAHAAAQADGAHADGAQAAADSAHTRIAEKSIAEDQLELLDSPMGAPRQPREMKPHAEGGFGSPTRSPDRVLVANSAENPTSPHPAASISDVSSPQALDHTRSPPKGDIVAA